VAVKGEVTVTGVEEPAPTPVRVAITTPQLSTSRSPAWPALQAALGPQVRFMAIEGSSTTRSPGRSCAAASHRGGPRQRRRTHIPSKGPAARSRKANWSAYPEATISRSSRSRGSKSGAARMAIPPPTCRSCPQHRLGRPSGLDQGHPKERLWAPQGAIRLPLAEADQCRTLPHRSHRPLLAFADAAPAGQGTGRYARTRQVEFRPHRLGGGAPTLGESQPDGRRGAIQKAGSKSRPVRPSQPTTEATGSGHGAGFPPLEIAVRRGDQGPSGPRITYYGLRNIPERGGA